MFTPVRCHTCGMPTGELAPFFRAALKARAEAVLGERRADPLSACVDAGLQLESEDLLEALGVVAPLYGDCCRKTLVTAVHFLDHY